MGRHRSQHIRTRQLVVGITAALTLSVAGSAAGTPTNAILSALVGKWTRTVTSADVKRTGTNGVPMESYWTLIVDKNGATIVGGSNGGQFEGRIGPIGANKVRIRIGDPTANVYVWQVSAKRLTFTRVKDKDKDRAAVFWGTWRRAA